MRSHSEAHPLACNIMIDYSSVPGSRVLPFEFSLDLNKSVLEPGPGQRQRFCYHVRAMGSDEFCYVNLSYFMIGLCEDVCADQLGEITVTRNGMPEMVVLGDNVKLISSDAPDANTGCSGLKFCFPLDKKNGEMDVSFELTRPYRIGAQPVCVYGSGVSETCCRCAGPCAASTRAARASRTSAPASACRLPLHLRPRRRGDRLVLRRAVLLRSIAAARPPALSGCTFLVTQMMCVSVPITFTAGCPRRRRRHRMPGCPLRASARGNQVGPSGGNPAFGRPRRKPPGTALKRNARRRNPVDGICRTIV